jgi:hypothetical protein
MEEHVLDLLYCIFASSDRWNLAKQSRDLMKSSLPTMVEELGRMEKDADTDSVRWIATAKLALRGDELRLKALENEALRQIGYPNEKK